MRFIAGAHRRRSNTAQRLERMKKEKRNQSKVKNISWKDNNLQYNGNLIQTGYACLVHLYS